MAWSDTQITVKVPQVGIGSQAVEVHTPRGVSNPVPFVVVEPPPPPRPVLDGVEPQQAEVGMVLTLTGSHFGDGLNSTVTVGGVVAEVV